MRVANMSQKNQPWIVKENKAGNTSDSPRFYIDYRQGHPPAENPDISRQIITRLKGNLGLVAKVDSSLLNLPLKQRDQLVLDLVEGLKLAGLAYRYRQFSGPISSNSWIQLFSPRKQELHHEVLIAFPGESWQQSPQFGALGHGTFYYPCVKPGQEMELLEALRDGQLLNENSNPPVKLKIFDWTVFGQMGLFTETLTLQDLQTLLA
jgi:hypothetical protein